MPLVERNLAILGSPSVGKSALTLRFCKDEFSEIYDPTILKKYSHRVRNQVNHVEYDLTIFDTAGLEQQSQIQTSYVNSNGFILVYSIADRKSFDIVKDVYNKLVDELNGEKKPVILIGNKSDLGDQRRVQADEGLSLAKEMNASFIETSARHNENVRDVFETLLCRIDPPSQDLNNHNHQGANAHNNNINNSNNNNRQQTNSRNNNNQGTNNQKPSCTIS